jgi:hypothetical protein
MVFSKGRLPNFRMNNMELEIVSEFILLKMSYIALDAFSARLILFFLKNPVL